MSLLIQTLAYSDIYNFPLTKKEIYRYFSQLSLSYQEFVQKLKSPDVLTQIGNKDGYYFLKGKEILIETRRSKYSDSKLLWKYALHYGMIMAYLPFVRMIAVTGSLALNNSSFSDDIDYLIVTKKNYLWICRFLITLIVILGKLRGLTLCPNYLLTEDNLVIKTRNIYTARELVQMKPIYGHEIYLEMLQLNSWIKELLPNADSYQNAPFSISINPFKTIIEYIFANPITRHLDRLEMKRIQQKYIDEISTSEIEFTRNCCKGHFNRHLERSINRFDQRMNIITNQIQIQTTVLPSGSD